LEPYNIELVKITDFKDNTVFFRACFINKVKKELCLGQILFLIFRKFLLYLPDKFFAVKNNGLNFFSNEEEEE
jgi:hypothetical protein